MREIYGAPLFFLYPRGSTIFAIAAVLCYIPIFLCAYALFEISPLRTTPAARGLGVVGAIVACLAIYFL